jgi:hypothetical protein
MMECVLSGGEQKGQGNCLSQSPQRTQSFGRLEILTRKKTFFSALSAASSGAGERKVFVFCRAFRRVPNKKPDPEVTKKDFYNFSTGTKRRPETTPTASLWLHPVKAGYFDRAAKNVPSSRFTRSRRESLSLALEITSAACWAELTGWRFTLKRMSPERTPARSAGLPG